MKKDASNVLFLFLRCSYNQTRSLLCSNCRSSVLKQSADNEKSSVTKFRIRRGFATYGPLNESEIDFENEIVSPKLELYEVHESEEESDQSNEMVEESALNEEEIDSGADIEQLGLLSTKDLFNLVKPNLREGRSLKHYVHSTFHLQVLVSLFGVDLYKVDQKRSDEFTRIFLRTSLQNDVIPRLQLFQTFFNITPRDFGIIIGKCPNILEHPIASVNDTLNHLKKMNFPAGRCKLMIMKHPRCLVMSPALVDDTLSILQRMTNLPAEDVKNIVMMTPRLLTANLDLVAANRDMFRDRFLFTVEDFHRALLLCPEILLNKRESLEEIFAYLKNEMNVSNELISHSAEVFKNNLRNIKTLHQYLKFLRRDQFNRDKPLYVSLKHFARQPLNVCENLNLNREHMIKFMKTL